MSDFSNGVAVPGGASYAPSLADFSQFARWASQFQQGQLYQQQQQTNTQAQQLNQQAIQRGQQQQDISTLFQGGAPKTYTEMFQAFLKKGDYDDAMKLVPLMQTEQAASTPQITPGQAGPPPQGPQPTSVAAPPLPPAAPNAPQGDSPGSIIARTTDLLPPNSDKVGVVATNIAKALKVDPNAPLTPEQAQKADDMLRGYAERNNIQPRGGDLPPSANAVSPAPPASSAPASFADRFAGLPPQAPAPQRVPAVAAAPPQQPAPQQRPQGQPIVPPVPLPSGHTNPQEAAMYLKRRAAEIETANPKTKPTADMWRDWAKRIEDSIDPLKVGTSETIVSPRDSSVLYQGPGAASYRGAGGETGQLVRMENAERAARGEPPMTAQDEISFIQAIRPPRSAPAMAVESFKKDFQQQNGRPPSAEEITKFASNYSREQSYGRAAGSQGARVENASNEVEQLIPQAVEASRAYDRQGGRFVGLNKLFQAYDQGTSDPKYNDFVLANFSLINAYTRAMNPQGVPRIAERLEQHAMGILSTATDQKAYEVQVRRLWKEVQASKTATAETAKGVTPGNINAPVPGLDPPTAPAGAGGITPGGLSWSVE